MQKLKEVILNNGVKQKFFLSFQKESRVLELGCGIGRNAMFIKNYYNNIEYHGVDILNKEKVDEYIDYKNCNLENNKLPYEHLPKPYREQQKQLIWV